MPCYEFSMTKKDSAGFGLIGILIIIGALIITAGGAVGFVCV